jgi:hypothetical protein
MANKPNETFKLNVKDIEHIESALRLLMSISDIDKKREVNELLGKFYNQKHFYRSSKNIYISG